MGHKVHPKIYRTGILFPWISRWVSTTKYSLYLEQDIKIREDLNQTFKEAQIDSVFIERSAKNITITIFAGKPGIVIGRGGQGLEVLKKDIERKFLKMSIVVKLNVQEIRAPSLSATIIAQGVAKDIESRIPFRRIMKSTIERIMKAGAEGVKISVSGRLNGAEIARRETLSSGKIPLTTLRSNVDYTDYTARTIYGSIGVKVWIYLGESFVEVDKLAEKTDSIKHKKSTNQRTN